MSEHDHQAEVDLYGVCVTCEREQRGAALRDEALARVEENASDEWLAAARQVILALPAGQLFTTDTVWASLSLADVRTHEPRALGAVMRQLALAGAITKTSDYKPSIWPENHARPVAVWRRSENMGG